MAECDKEDSVLKETRRIVIKAKAATRIAEDIFICWFGETAEK